jgi:4-amino-4-deoxy-L-arabinose transferase-like glycosyltransferase
VVAAGFLAMIVGTAGTYGWMGDELYYIACGKHLAFGYVDHPPIVALVAWLTQSLFGESLVAFRFVSGLAGAGTILLAARIASALGGGRSAQANAALLIFCSTSFPAIAGFFSMNAFDLLLTALFTLQIIRTVETPTPQAWILSGVIAGVGLLNKYTFLVLGFSLLVAFLATDKRTVLASRWPFIGGAVAMLLFLPHILWQIVNDFPTREFILNATSLKNISLSPIDFLTQLIIVLNPFTAPFWLIGFVTLFRDRGHITFRYLGVMVAIFFSIYLLQNSKFYYVVPVFPLLFAAGAVQFERWWSGGGRRWIQPVSLACVLLSGILLLPLAVPVLSVQRFVPYAKSLGLWDAIRMETWEGDTLPIHYVHRLGWPALVDSVAAAYASLSEEEQQACGIVGSWYGPAAAVDHFGASYGLPPAISGHNSYWTWGDGGYSGEIMILAGFDEKTVRDLYRDVTYFGTVAPAYGSARSVYLCRDPKIPLVDLWPRLRQFI